VDYGDAHVVIQKLEFHIKRNVHFYFVKVIVLVKKPSRFDKKSLNIKTPFKINNFITYDRNRTIEVEEPLFPLLSPNLGNQLALHEMNPHSQPLFVLEARLE